MKIEIRELLEQELVNDILQGDTTVLHEILNNLSYGVLYDSLSDEGQSYYDSLG